MPASAIGVRGAESKLLHYIPFKKPVPDRRIVLIWRKSYPRSEAINALTEIIKASAIPGVTFL